MNAWGQIVKTIQLSEGGKIAVSIKDLPAGIYLLKSSDAKLKSLRIIIE